MHLKTTLIMEAEMREIKDIILRWETLIAALAITVLAVAETSRISGWTPF